MKNGGAVRLFLASWVQCCEVASVYGLLITEYSNGSLRWQGHATSIERAASAEKMAVITRQRSFQQA